MATLALNELGRHVLDSPAKRVRPIVNVLIEELLAKPEVAQTNVSLLIEENILQLDVPVNDPELVQVLQRERNLPNVEFDLGLVEALSLEQVREQLAAPYILQNEMELGVRLKGVVESDEKGRLAHRRQHLPLRLDMLGRLGLLHNGRLLEHLHRVELAGVGAAALAHQKHLAVGARAQHLQQLEVLHAHFLALVIRHQIH